VDGLTRTRVVEQSKARDRGPGERPNMFTMLNRWSIEVDQDKQQCNFAAQQIFIRDFGGNVYQAVERMPALRYVYFTRIFYPSRDQMGA
jgi:hypothetical protein